MKNPELYKKSIDALVNAYFNNTLVHQKCAACAVGNLIAVSNGYEITDDKASWTDSHGNRISPVWSDIHYYSSSYERQVFNIADEYKYMNNDVRKQNRKIAITQLESTGYTIEETAKIEFAFETAPKSANYDERMFNGLMAVIDVLDEIHENNNPEVTLEQKNRFTKELQTV